MRNARRIALAAALSTLAACGGADERPFDLCRSLAGASRVEVVVPPGFVAPRLERLARELDRRGELSAELREGSASDELAARLWIADARTSGLERFCQEQGVTFDASTSAVQWDGRSYSGPREALQITAADPERPGWPVTVVFASRASFAADFVAELAPTWKPGYRAWRDGRIEREGLFGPAGELRESSASDVLARIEERSAVALPGARADVVVHGEIDRAALATYLACLDRVHEAVRELLGEPRERLRVDLWPNLESLRAATSSREFACSFPGDANVHAAVASADLHDGGAAYARAAARLAATAPADDWMPESVGAALANAWAPGTTLDAWRDQLLMHERLPDWGEVLDPPRRASPHEIGAWRAILVRELLAAGRADVVQRQWNEGWSSTSVDLAMVDAVLARERERVAALDARDELRERRRERALSNEFRAGMHLVESSDGDGRGSSVFGSSACVEALEAVRARGARWVALSPVYSRAERTTWWPNTERPAPFDSTASDDSLLATAWHARRLGLKVAFTPHLVDGPGGTLADATMALSAERADEYFADLRAVLVHVCALAALADADLVSLGSDLAQSTRHMTTESEGGWIPPEHMLRSTERWRALIADLRARYDGALVYTAGAGDEWRFVQFWSELDFVGLELYRPVSPDLRHEAPPSLADATSQCLGGLRALQRIASELGKPLLVTEVGFGPTDRAWLEPRLAPGEIAPTVQSTLHQAFGAALAIARRQRVAPAGVFVWCWTIGESADERSFALNGRPAAALFPAYFGGR